jgi:hypothetical protein
MAPLQSLENALACASSGGEQSAVVTVHWLVDLVASLTHVAARMCATCVSSAPVAREEATASPWLSSALFR